ncbi:helix-turn-helix domain-containing protein [Leptospira sp. 96542]|nr:helix-turn-helix domain-containing protein [Leptospira sp. 96542]
MSVPPQNLNPLVFGEDSGKTFDRIQAFGEVVKPLWSHLRGLDTRSGNDRFRLRMATLMVPGMALLACSATSLQVDLADNTRAVIAFTRHGQSQLRLQERKFKGGGDADCLFLPTRSGPMQADIRGDSLLVIQIDPSALAAAARAVLGLERGHPVNLACEHPRMLTTRSPPAPLALADHIGATINLHGGNPLLLDRLGFQDFVCRQMVLLLRPDWQAAAALQRYPAAAHRRRAIERVCDAMLADLSGRFTMSGLAELAGMSVRGLQYAFQSRFGRSPMQWLRDQRLDQVRQKLVAGTDDSITQMALGCGFATASAFSAFYRRRYGESPSETRARRG